jgi:N4-gp56 family major capsid protein
MAKSTMETTNALRVQVWKKKLFEDAKIASFFMGFSGKTSGDYSQVIQIDEDLTKGEGDKMTFGMVPKLAGDGITGGQTLEGNEEALTDYDFSVELEQYRHAVRDKGKLVAKRPIYDMRAVAKEKLKIWSAEKMDRLAFDTAKTAVSKVYFNTGSAIGYYANSLASAKTALTATGKITGKMLTKMATAASTGWNRTQTPLKKININGREVYMVVVHPDIMDDLFNDATFQQSFREAHQRGNDNPLFKGMETYFWKDCCIVAHELTPIFTNGGAGANVAGGQCFFMGAQSLVWAWGQPLNVVKKMFDYDNEVGYAVDWISKCAVPTFNSLNYGMFNFVVARTQISDESATA